MQRKFLFGSILALLSIFSVLNASAQAIYAAREGASRLSIGAGFSTYDQDWGPGQVLGSTVWVDLHPPFMDGFLHDFSIELEGRDLSANRGTITNPVSPVVGRPILPRTDTIGGGILFEPRRLRFHRFQPYAKALIGYGSIDFTLSNAPAYSHDTRTEYAFGGGVDFRINRRLSARADYEYQFWPSFLSGTLNPQGLTVGASYNFGRR